MSKNDREQGVAKQERAISALLSCSTLERAAEETGISSRTLRRWLSQDEEFREQLRQARQALVDHALGAIQGACTLAVTTLIEVMSGGSASPAARVSAAKAVLDLAVQVSENELEERIARLERLFQEKDQGGRR